MRPFVLFSSVVAIGLSIAAPRPALGQPSLTYQDLVHRMVDLEYLATLPDAGEGCAQWSSCDRASHYNETTGKYVNWEANGDGNGFIREEGESLVLAEMTGPGCLWRIWSALPEKGHVKIFLDGAAEPAVDLPFEQYFTGKTAPFDFPTLSYALEDQGCRGKNLYYPGGLFQTPYHCQTMTQGNKGHQSVLRWHTADNVPFMTSFEGVMEKYFPNDWPTRYAATVCWYLSANGADPHEPVAVDERDTYYDRPPRTPGGFKLLSEPPGDVKTQQMGNFTGGKWDKNDQLWWTQAKPGDNLELAIPIKQDGKYELAVVLTKANDYAIVRLHVDDRKAANPIDLYNPTVISTDPIPLGEFELKEGEHKLTVEITANEEAKKAYMFGLDKLIIKRLQ